jgi:excisionase family DNA binding protein
MKKSTAQRRLARITFAAEYATVSTKTIRRRISDGTIRGFRAGPKLILVDLDDVDEKLIRSIPTTGTSA